MTGPDTSTVHPPTSDDGAGPRPEPGRPVLRWPFAVLAYLFVGLALVGVVIPGLPTFPFLLLAGWAASRGSKRVHDWLYQHPRFGPALLDWRETRSISARAKAWSVALMALSWLILLWRVGRPWILGLTAALFLTVGSYVVTRPLPERHDR